MFFILTGEILVRFYQNNLNKTREGAVIKVESKNGKSIDSYSDAKEWEFLHKSNSKFRLKEIQKDYIVNLDNVIEYQDQPLKSTLYVIEEL